MLIDSSFFEAERKIIDKDEAAVKFNLLACIAVREAEFLNAVLGPALASAFLVGIQAENPAVMWKELRDGVDYLDNTNTLRRWPGLIQEYTLQPAVMDGENVVTPAVILKRSPIADYVYYHFVKDLHVQMTAISTVKNKGENSVPVSPAGKMNAAWNDMATVVRELFAFLYANADVYGWTEYGTFGWYGYPYNGYFWIPFISNVPHVKRLALAQKTSLL